MSTPNLELPEVPQAILEASGEINEGFARLDTVVQLTVSSRTTITPPIGVQGMRYVVPTGAIGVWMGRQRHVAYYTPNGWAFLIPRYGWKAVVEDENGGEIFFDGEEWISSPVGDATAVNYDNASSGLSASNVQEAIDELASSSGGGGVPDGTPLVFHHINTGADSSGWGGFSLISRIRGKRLLNTCQAFKFTIEVTSGSMIVTGVVARRTLSASTTYVDSTTVTFGGVSNPTLATGVHTSDDIAVPVDTAHDYYIIFFINASTLAGASFKLGNDSQAEVFCGSQSGDHRADASFSGSVSGGNAYGKPEFFAT